MLLLRELPKSKRPRERLIEMGPCQLSDAELLAILLGSGIRGKDVLKVSASALPLIDQQWPNLSHSDIRKVSGIGTAKAALIVAALEFARRRIRPKGVRIGSAQDVIPLLSHFTDRHQEHFICISLNGAHEVIALRVITIGLVNSTQVHPREVFSDLIVDRASAVIVAHNHPSGNVEPSEEDKRVTRTLAEAGKLLGIKLLDHVIFSGNQYYSFADQGAL